MSESVAITFVGGLGPAFRSAEDLDMGRPCLTRGSSPATVCAAKNGPISRFSRLDGGFAGEATVGASGLKVIALREGVVGHRQRPDSEVSERFLAAV